SPELDQDERDARDAGEHVHALAEPVAPRGRGGLRQPGPRVVLVVAEQAGAETDQHADAQHSAHPGRDRRPMQRTTESRPEPWPLPEPNREAHVASVGMAHRARPLQDAERADAGAAGPLRTCEGSGVGITRSRVGLVVALTAETVLLAFAVHPGETHQLG